MQFLDRGRKQFCPAREQIKTENEFVSTNKPPTAKELLAHDVLPGALSKLNFSAFAADHSVHVDSST